MKLKTKVDVNYNQGVTGTQSGKVIGIIESCGWGFNFETVGVSYSYMTENDQVIHRDNYIISGKSQITTLYNDISTNLTDLGNKPDNEEQSFLEGFKYVMAQTFGITVADIEIVE